MAVDYEKMLVAVIKHFADMEGTDHLGNLPEVFIVGLDTNEEFIELGRLRDIARSS